MWDIGGSGSASPEPNGHPLALNLRAPMVNRCASRRTTAGTTEAAHSDL